MARETSSPGGESIEISWKADKPISNVANYSIPVGNHTSWDLESRFDHNSPTRQTLSGSNCCAPLQPHDGYAKLV